MKQLNALARIAALVMTFVLCQETWALAGTTGGISGVITSQTGSPLASATVTVSSPSQTASTVTDQSGHFQFLSLSPDTYTVSAQKEGYTPASIPGVSVFADNTQTIALHLNAGLKQIASVVSRAAGNLVKSGTTSDVYSVNAATQQTLAGVGGGYNMNSAYSAIYSQPGVTSFIGNNGIGIQVFYIRGASYTQTGFEFDGVPVNRAFDNYNSNSLSNIGQQELQVYTGGAPSSGTSQTLGGYVNQVIKTGTYPGFGSATVGLGTPAFYHVLNLEAGGATPNRAFSWYAGLGNFNQAYNLTNNKNLGDVSSDGMNPYGFFGSQAPAYMAFNTGHYSNGPFAACPNQDGTQVSPNAFTYPASEAPGGPVCNSYGIQQTGLLTTTSDREGIVNLHFHLPHRSDTGSDDLQLLYDASAAHSEWNDSVNDQGGLGAYQRAFAFIDPSLSNSACFLISQVAAPGFSNGQCASGGPSPFPYQDGYIWAPGTAFGQPAGSAVLNPYYFPSSPTNRALFTGIDPNIRGSVANDANIFKIQYQKNIGTRAYARLYAYTLYSDWLINSAPQASLYYALAGLGYQGAADYPSPDYELSTHTRGVSFEYANQLNEKHLLRFSANYVTASLDRFNNQTWLGNGLSTSATNLVDAAGNCYKFTTGVIGSCFSSSTSGTYGDPTRSTYCANPANTCAIPAGTSWIVTRQSGVGTTNGIVPKFTTLALEDEFRPTDKLDLNFGLRFERYQYDLVNSNTPEFNFWFNAAQKVYCYDPATLQPILQPLSPTSPPPASPVTTAPGAPCPVGPSGMVGLHPDGQNGNVLFSAASPSVLAHSVVSPRIGGTYTLNPDTVLRFSLGRYTQATPASVEQYLNQYGKSAASSDFSHFFGFGFYNPSHDNPVQRSDNADFSLEKRLKGTDVTFKLSPYYRYTTHQSVILNIGPNFNSSVNLGTQKSTGIEFQVQKGDPTRDGLSGAISYSYNRAVMRYENAPNGRNQIDVLNDYIKAFNGLTQAGGGAPCYDPNAQTQLGNAPDPSCAATSIKNPYYGFAPQATLNRNGFYATYQNAPVGDAPDFAGPTAIAPHFFSGWLQWKKNKLSIAPNFVLAQGGSYGGPTDVIGLDPRTCAANQGTTGAVPAASPYAQYADFFQCGATIATASGNLAVPNPYNGNNFSSLGQYKEPWQLNVGAQLRYQFSPKVSGVMTVANIFNRCFGGTKTPWQAAFPANNYDCGWTNFTTATSWAGGTGSAAVPGEGFFYGASPTDPANGTVALPKALLYPYGAFNGGLPIQAYFQLDIKL